MPIIGNNFWADAGNFGQGVGQSLAQGMLQLPMERYRLAQQQQQMGQQNALNMFYAQNAARQQQNEQQYRQQSLGQGQQQIDETKRHDTIMGASNDVRNELASQRIQIQELTALINGLKGGVVSAPEGGTVPQVGLGQTSKGTNAPPQDPFSGFQFQADSSRGGITQYQEQNFDLKKLMALAALMSSTNPAFQGLINQVQGLGGQRMPQNNPSFRQRPDGSFDFLGQ